MLPPGQEIFSAYKETMFTYFKKIDQKTALDFKAPWKTSGRSAGLLQNGFTNTHFSLIQLGVILVFSLVPLLFNLPYRVNIFLSWEGAYRLYLGQMPFRDFGMPLGFGYFAMPALFFKIFGPYLFSLVYAQAFINILTLLSFRSVLRLLGVRPANVLLAILVMCLTFTFPINFWPWYNNSAFVYGLFGLNMVLFYMFRQEHKFSWLYLTAAAFFMAFSLLTKQDYGGLSFVFGLVLLAFEVFHSRSLKGIAIYAGAYAVFAGIMIAPFLPHDFLYWFNYGQAPHDSRLHLTDFANEAFGGSFYEKFYILLIGFVLFLRFNSFNQIFSDKQEGALLLVCLGMVLMALVTKVTSRLPADTSTYFHAFAFAYIAEGMTKKIRTSSFSFVFCTGFLVLFWWSGVFWKYVGKLFSYKNEAANTEAALNWQLTNYKAFENVYLPEETVKGIERLKNLEVIRENDGNLKVLNMSELTPLAHELGFTPLTGQPLWYHLNIGMFNQQVEEFNQRVQNEYYDLVLFEDIPSLTEFYPYEVREELLKSYELKDRFLAPRALGDSYIEVYTRKSNAQ